MNKGKLVLSLDEEGPLVTDMRQEGQDVYLSLGPQLLQHCIYHNVGAWTSTKCDNLGTRNNFGATILATLLYIFSSLSKGEHSSVFKKRPYFKIVICQ